MMTLLMGHTDALKLHAVIALVPLFSKWTVIQLQHPRSFKFKQASCSAHFITFLNLLFYSSIFLLATLIGASVLLLIRAKQWQQYSI